MRTLMMVILAGLFVSCGNNTILVKCFKDKQLVYKDHTSSFNVQENQDPDRDYDVCVLRQTQRKVYAE